MCKASLGASLCQITSNGRGLDETNILPETVFYVAKNRISRNSIRKQYNRKRKRTKKDKEEKEKKERGRERDKSHLLKEIGSRQTSRKRLVD